MKLIYGPIMGNTPQIVQKINEYKLAKYVLAIEYRTRQKGYVILKVPDEEEERIRGLLQLEDLKYCGTGNLAAAA